MYARLQADLGDDRGEGHNPGHDVKNGPDGVREVEADVARNRPGIAPLGLGDLVGEGDRLTRRHVLGQQSIDDPRAQLIDQHGAQDRQTEAGGEVAHRLCDPGRFTVGEARGAVHGVGARGRQHQSHAEAGQDHVEDLIAEVELGDLARPQTEAHGGERASDDDRTLRTSLVQQPATDLGRRREAEEEVEQVQASLLRGLAEGYLGVLTREEEDRHERQHRDAQDEVLHEERPDGKDVHLHEW